MSPVAIFAEDDYVFCPVCQSITEIIGSHNWCSFCGYIVPCCEPDVVGVGNGEKDVDR